LIRRKQTWRSNLFFLLVPVVVYFAFAMRSHVNIGHRHLLPVLPFLYVVAGGLGAQWERISNSQLRRWSAVGFAAVLLVMSSIAFYPPWRPQLVYPHYLAYFNELAGGPRSGWHGLSDSNIDWGQDLPGLKKWLDRNPQSKPIYLCYFGSSEPKFYQIQHLATPQVLGAYPATPYPAPANQQIQHFSDSLKKHDIIAISVTNMVGAHLSAAARDFIWELTSRSTLLDRVGYSIYIYRYDG
jgi:hypothetical protein